MKRTFGYAALLMGTVAFTAPALADTTPSEGTPPQQELNIQGDVGTTGSTGAMDFSLQPAGAEEIRSLTNVESVEVVRADDVAGENQPAMLDETIAANQDYIAELHEAIEANASLRQELEAQQVFVADVLAAEVIADNNVRVYVR